MWAVIGSSAASLAKLDEGKTLWQVFEAMMEVDGWWET
jgi:hypothetical protein